MLSPEILNKIRHLEIQTRRMLSGTMAGDTTVAHKGFGIEFDQLRDYQQGDDVRFIDWRATARMNKTMVKEYLDDRNRLIHLMVDVSPSMEYGSGYNRKIDVAAQVASALALIADFGKDHVSLTLYTDRGVKKFIPTGRGRAHIHEIMKQLFCQAEKQEDTDSTFDDMGHHIAQAMKRSSLVCVLSDFARDVTRKHIMRMGKRHDVVALRITDPLEKDFPAVGGVAMQGVETSKIIAQLSSNTCSKIMTALQDRRNAHDRECAKHRIDTVDIVCSDDVLAPIVRFFRRRMSY